MKRAVVTLAIGDVARLASLTLGGLRGYAHRCDADFRILDRFLPDYPTIPSMAKFLLPEIVRQYERVAYIDLDCLIRRDAPSIFETFPDVETLYAYDESEIWRAKGVDPIAHMRERFGVELSRYFNAGVMLLPSGDRGARLLDPIDVVPLDIYPEQSILNARVVRDGYRYADIGRRWNSLGSFRPLAFEDDNAWIVHYAGLVGCNRVRVLSADLALYGDEYWRGPA